MKRAGVLAILAGFLFLIAGLLSGQRLVGLAQTGVLAVVIVIVIISSLAIFGIISGGLALQNSRHAPRMITGLALVAAIVFIVDQSMYWTNPLLLYDPILFSIFNVMLLLIPTVMAVVSAFLVRGHVYSSPVRAVEYPSNEPKVTSLPESNPLGQDSDPATEADHKHCPDCAEQVRNQANICRYCGYDFIARGRAASNETSGYAIASLVLGLAWLGGLASVLALIFGYQARADIRASRGRVSGGGMALAGIVLGWVGIAIMAVSVLLFLAAAAGVFYP